MRHFWNAFFDDNKYLEKVLKKYSSPKLGLRPLGKLPHSNGSVVGGNGKVIWIVYDVKDRYLVIHSFSIETYNRLVDPTNRTQYANLFEEGWDIRYLSDEIKSLVDNIVFDKSKKCTETIYRILELFEEIASRDDWPAISQKAKEDGEIARRSRKQTYGG